MNPIIESLNRYAAANRWSIDGGVGRTPATGQLEFPVIWHQPLALTGKIGRNEGLLTYKLSFLLMEKEGNVDRNRKEEVRETLEHHALGMIRTLEEHPRIRQVRLLSCLPAQSAVTHYGEIALTVTLEVELFFCHRNAV